MRRDVEVKVDDARTAPTPIPSGSLRRRQQRQSIDEESESYAGLGSTYDTQLSGSFREGGIRIGRSPHMALRPIVVRNDPQRICMI
jgi:hypothetical protein